MYYPEYLRAKERNRTEVYQRKRRRRQTIAERTFASLDRLSWARSRLRGLWKVDCEGYMAALAHNVLKMVRRLGHGVGPLSQPSAALDVSGGLENTPSRPLSGTSSPPVPPWSFFVPVWLSENFGLSFR